MFYLE